jgi:hypothetical protein
LACGFAKLRAVLAFLVTELKIPVASLGAVLAGVPAVLTQDVARQLRPTIELIQTLGFPPEDLGESVSPR